MHLPSFPQENRLILLDLTSPGFSAVKMQPLSLADEHPEGTTRIIFSVTSIRRLCFITSLFLSHGFQLSKGKDLRGLSQAYYQKRPTKLFTGICRNGSLYVLKVSSHGCFLCSATKQQKHYISIVKHENQTKTAYSRRQRALFSERDVLFWCYICSCRALSPTDVQKVICRCQKHSSWRQKSCSHRRSLKLN